MSTKRVFILSASILMVISLCWIGQYANATYFAAAFLCGAAQARTERR